VNTKLVQVPYHPEWLMGWSLFFVLFALFLAAVLHWKVSRHWTLLAFAAGSLCFLIGYALFLFGPMLLQRTWNNENYARLTFYNIFIAQKSCQFAGIILAGIGAVGSIVRALKLKRNMRPIDDPHPQ
jgi:hypothetical protein